MRHIQYTINNFSRWSELSPGFAFLRNPNHPQIKEGEHGGGGTMTVKDPGIERPTFSTLLNMIC